MSNSTDDVEKNADSLKRMRTPNDIPNTVIRESAKSKNCFRNLLEAPCGQSSEAVGYITIALSGLLMWALLFALLGHEVEPGGQLFQLIVLGLASHFCGWLLSLLYIPRLLGMLLCGILLRNIGFFHVTGVYMEIISVIRQVALALNLLKAGLGLDAGALKKLSFVVAALAFLTCLTETVGAAVAAYILVDLPWMWGLLLGSIVSAVSPSIVVPMLQDLKKDGYGENKGISTLVIAASSINDIIAISAFGVLLGMIFSKGDLTHNILQGPLEVALGLVVGISWGVLAACIPHRNENYLTAKRSFIVGGGGLGVILLSTMYGYSGSGPLATIILSFVAQLCWKWQGWSSSYNPVADVISICWNIIEPLLFGLIGTEIRIDQIKLDLLGFGVAILVFSVLIRIPFCCISLIGANLNLKEVIFVNLAWIPKATVQATLGPIALDFAIRYGLIDAVPNAQYVLTISVLCILVTAPIGAISISVGGPRLLSNEPVVKKHINMTDQKSNIPVIEDHRL